MADKKPFKLQRECHTFATIFATCNAYNNKQDGGRILNSPASERWALIGPFWQYCVASCWRDVTRKQLARNVAKSRESFYFSCNHSQRNNCSCKMGCYTWIFFLQLATQRLLRGKLQEKLLRVTWPQGAVEIEGVIYFNGDPRYPCDRFDSWLVCRLTTSYPLFGSFSDCRLYARYLQCDFRGHLRNCVAHVSLKQWWNVSITHHIELNLKNCKVEQFLKLIPFFLLPSIITPGIRLSRSYAFEI